MQHHSPPMASLAAIVLAGGQGTRLFPLTKTRCKPAVCFAGKYRLIDIPLSSALNSQIPYLFVIAQHFAEGLKNHILSSYQDVQIHFLQPQENENIQTWFQGTADAVRKNLQTFLKTSADYFLILSGDHLYNIDFHNMFAFAKKTDADLVIATTPVKRKEAERMGIVKIDSHFHIVDFHEKPKESSILNRFENHHQPKTPFLASMGIYIFKKEALISLLQEEGNDFGTHLIPLQIQKGKSYAYIYDNYWVDIGTIASFYAANMALLEQKNCLDLHSSKHPIYTLLENLPSPFLNHTNVSHSLICQGSILEAEEIHHSIIGVRSIVKKRTKIYNSILLGNKEDLDPTHFSVGKECIIKNVILDEDSQVGNHVTLTNPTQIQHLDGDGFYIREGITIVASGTKIRDGFVL